MMWLQILFGVYLVSQCLARFQVPERPARDVSGVSGGTAFLERHPMRAFGEQLLWPFEVPTAG